MSAVRVSCPGCGGPIVFPVGANIVAVCPYCRSVVARGDRNIEDLGKVAALVETGAVLQAGTKGRFQGVPFELTGRTQLLHEAGGVWDEWYAHFADGRWGWLAEAQGRYYLTFEKPAPGNLPALDELQVGRSAPLFTSTGSYLVAEKGTATVQGAEGVIPYRLQPGATYHYADLSGRGGAFATLDYGDDPPTLYTGQEVTLDELGVPPEARRDVSQLRQVAGKQLNCPHCGGQLELHAPDQTMRIGCPHCGSLLDASQGDLKLLTALDQSKLHPVIPLGSVGKFGTAERTVIGLLRRSVTYSGRDYFWQEYLLYHPRDGFEWLVLSDGHWSHVKSVPAGDVQTEGLYAWYRGKRFRMFQRAVATVRGVLGECYWKVHVGEQAITADFVAPPLMLSREIGGDEDGEAKEVNWSLGDYLTPAEVRQAFDLKTPLPTPEGVAPNQPFRYMAVYKLGVLFAAALLLLGIVLAVAIPKREVYTGTFNLTALPANQKTQTFFTDKFDLKGHHNVEVWAECKSLSGWLVIEGDLVRDADGTVQPFLLPLKRNSGVEGGESWSEGNTADDTFLSAQPVGTYSLKLEVEREKPTLTGPLTVRVEQGVSRYRNWVIAFLVLIAVPVAVGVGHLFFAMRRWQNSDYSPFSNSG